MNAKLIYLKGQHNTIADFMSRYRSQMEPPTYAAEIYKQYEGSFLEHVFSRQQRDNDLELTIREIKAGEPITHYFYKHLTNNLRVKAYDNQKLDPEILVYVHNVGLPNEWDVPVVPILDSVAYMKDLHLDELNSHPGVKGMVDKARGSVWIKDLHTTANYVKEHCGPCEQTKTEQYKNRFAETLPAANQNSLAQHWHIDLFGSINGKNGEQYYA